MIEESMHDGTNRGDDSFSHFLKWQTNKNGMIARNLSREAMMQWQKAANGVVALPAAVALTAAANSLFIAAFIERCFDVFQSSAEAMGREIQTRAQEQTRETRAQDQVRDSVNRTGNQPRNAQPQS